MFDYISGKIDELQPAAVTIDNNGIGYYINISLQTFEAISALSEARIYVHQYSIRDELPVMYGFFTRQERELFRMLINVTGVGGNTARMILSTFTLTELKEIISAGKSHILKTVKGLGIKTAEKIIVELRDKIAAFGVEEDDIRSDRQGHIIVDNDIYEEALSALTMLGFSRQASGKAVKHIMSENPSAKVEDVIRLALKKL